jgi:hypothetical protein
LQNPKEVREEATKKHLSRLTEKSDNEMKTTWNIIKKQTGKIHSINRCHPSSSAIQKIWVVPSVISL